MYKIPERTEAQKKYWENFRFEEWKQEERQRRKATLSHVVIRKETDNCHAVYYKGCFICCLFDNDEIENERMLRIIVNLLEVVNGRC